VRKTLFASQEDH